MKENEGTTRINEDRYNRAIEYLYGLQHHGIKLGLSNIRRVLELLGDPQANFRSVHVAGTNGKGSTSSIIASVLQRAGFKVGLFTSPHLVSFTERIRINGSPIPVDEVISITDIIRGLLTRETELMAPTFFEFVTAMAFYYFRQERIEWAVIETGMGGRLDSTNVIEPEVTAITQIAMDHSEFLGDSIELIAAEKAGIVKSGVPVITAAQSDEAEQIILDRAVQLGSDVYRFGHDFRAENIYTDIDGTTFDYSSDIGPVRFTVPLSGKHQAENASIAIKVIELILGPAADTSMISNGVSKTRWEGRCELFNWEVPILFDGAHNPASIDALISSLKMIYLKQFSDIIFIIGSMGDKDIKGLLERLLPVGRLTIFTTLNFERAASSHELKRMADRHCLNTIAVENTGDALRAAKKNYKEGDLIVVTGSFYAVGEAKGHIGQDSSLIGLTEFR
ncbi:MAG: bifunctional folylpolyglutamate synthase/dihydrofolate synthase [Nitrospirota bacterium]|nr:MAG: bifunctional folylpolyglutamate synthase/dihydrofolate synthase [Nitrospirota bacterium]